MSDVAPRVSVVIPAYNRADLVGFTIDSVLAQTVSVDEIIVVDDGSTDATAHVVREYSPRVTLLSQRRAGPGAARNRALESAAGAWIAFLDSDDIWAADKIARQLEYVAQRPDCAFVHTGYSEFGNRETQTEPSAHFQRGDYSVEDLLFAENWICTSSVMIRADVKARFREWASLSEDIILFGDLLRRDVRFGYVDDPLVRHRIHEASANHEFRAQSRGAAFQWQWVADVFASEPSELRRLQDAMMAKALNRLETAKWSRDWDRHAEWRNWLIQRWPRGVPRSPQLTETIYPAAMYSLADMFPWVTGRQMPASNGQE